MKKRLMKTNVDISSCGWQVGNKIKVHKLYIVDGHDGKSLWQGANMLPSSWTWFIDPSQWHGLTHIGYYL